jgi:hypothetical protein
VLEVHLTTHTEQENKQDNKQETPLKNEAFIHPRDQNLGAKAVEVGMSLEKDIVFA